MSEIDDGIRDMTRDSDWNIVGLLTRVEPLYVEFRVESPGMDAADGIIVGSVRRLAFTTKDEAKAFWKQIPELSPKDLNTATREGLIDIRSIRLSITNKGSNITVGVFHGW